MADPTEFKEKICKIIFDRPEFIGSDKIIEQLSDSQEHSIYDWLKKETWPIRDLLTFRHAFRLENTAYRILLIKVKNSSFIEFHLGKHKYYDRIRKELMLREDSTQKFYKNQPLIPHSCS